MGKPIKSKDNMGKPRKGRLMAAGNEKLPQAIYKTAGKETTGNYLVLPQAPTNIFQNCVIHRLHTGSSEESRQTECWNKFWERFTGWLAVVIVPILWWNTIWNLLRF